MSRYYPRQAAPSEPTYWQARLVRYLHQRGFAEARIAYLFNWRVAMVRAIVGYEVQPDAGVMDGDGRARRAPGAAPTETR